VAHYYPENINTLSFYAEIYGTDAYFTDVEEYLLVYSISKKGKNGRINGYKKMKKEQKNALKAVLASIDISDLTSGNYQLGVAVRNQKNELVTEKYITFQRNKKAQVQVLNDIDAIKTMDVSQTFVAQLSNDEVLYFLQAAKHRCEARGKSYIDNILKSNDSELQRRYLYNFWAGKNPHDPQEAFVAYKELIDQAERLYKTQLFHGFDSDRGRVLVQYGRPNDIMEVENEPGALPYEIWHYYQLQTVTDVGTQSNVKFVFYNPNIADNEFELLHSNARSEINDPNWEMKIYNSFKEQSGSHNFDNQNVREHYGRRARDLFDGKY